MVYLKTNPQEFLSMKITVNQLRRIIKEEVSRVLREGGRQAPGQQPGPIKAEDVLTVLYTLPPFSENPTAEGYPNDYKELASFIAGIKNDIAAGEGVYDPEDTIESFLMGTPAEYSREEATKAVMEEFFGGYTNWGI